MKGKYFLILLFFHSCISIIHCQTIITQNPLLETKHQLDKKFEIEIQTFSNNEEWEQILLKYTKLWWIELERNYEELLTILDKKDKNILAASQKAWYKHYELKKKFFFQYLYINNFENLVGREGYFHLLTYLMNEVRNRALELNAYLFYQPVE